MAVISSSPTPENSFVLFSTGTNSFITGSSVVNTTEMFDLLYYNQGIESRESKEEPANDTEDHKDR
jgi:hypothetical protein